MNLSFDGMGDQPAQLGGGSHLRTHRDVSTLLVSSILTIKSARAFKLTFDESKSIICHFLSISNCHMKGLKYYFQKKFN